MKISVFFSTKSKFSSPQLNDFFSINNVNNLASLKKSKKHSTKKLNFLGELLISDFIQVSTKRKVNIFR